MSEHIAVAVMVLVGVQFSCQAPINGRLGSLTGSLQAVLVNFAIGTVILLALVVAAGQSGQLADLTGVPPQYLTGGLLGAAFILASTSTVGTIGAGAVAAATITGQLVASLVLDEAGWLGLDRVGITGPRALGAVLLITGTLLIVWRRNGQGRLALWPLVAVAAAGCGIGMQPPINAELADRTGELTAALTSFAIGTAALATAVALSGRGWGIGGLKRARPWYFMGGVIGAVNVSTALIFVRTIGAAGLAASTIAGLLLGSIALDRIGFAGLERRELNPTRIGGAILLAIGTALVLL